MTRIQIISTGVGNTELLTQAAAQAIANSAVLIGDKRLLSPYQGGDKKLFAATRAQEILGIIANCTPTERIGVLVSGDVGFYSLAKSMLAALDEPAELHCGIGSLQYFAAKLQTPWQDICLLSLHGRDTQLLSKLKTHSKVFLLTGGTHNVSGICRYLSQHGFGDIQAAVGERLSYPDECITRGSVQELQHQEFASLSVLMLFNTNADSNRQVTHGLADECFARGRAPMTKQEVRAVSLSKLELRQADVFYDIGAGTGSVSIEAALLLNDGYVYALERDSESVELIHTNARKFCLENIQIIESYAPEGLADLPAPDKAFIGGSGGKLAAILDAIYAKNKACRIVLNCIALESLSACLEYYKDKKDYELEIVNISVAKAKKVASYNMMMGTNPIYIVTASRIDKAGDAHE